MSTTEYSFCGVCRRNHNQGRKHIFSAKHREKLSKILDKFRNKAMAARKALEKPVVTEGEVEPGATLWCYCCDKEVNKHVSDGLTTVESGGLVEHMTSQSHHKKARHFWWFHGADTQLLQTFIIFDAEYQAFKTRVADLVSLIEEKREQRLQEAANDLRVKEAMQMQLAREPPPPADTPPVVFVTVSNKNSVLQNPTGWHAGHRVWGGGIVKYMQGSDQLLVWEIDLLHNEGGDLPHPFGGSSEAEGNVHTGATPPWLKSDDDQDKVTTMGPSLDAFLLHKEQEKRANKNPNRVGADFHRTKPKGDSESWLPSFGRVWNAGSRASSMMEFCQELKRVVGGNRESSTAATPEDTGPSRTDLAQTTLKPYVRKRPLK